MGRLKNSTKNLPAKAGIAAGGGSFSNHRPAVRALLYSSVLTGGLLLVNGGTPAYAAPCTGGINGTNSTLCVIGTTNATLDYSPITAGNPLYVNGNFSLSLDDHDVNGATNGIEFSGVTGGDGFIELQDDSDVDGNGGYGINAAAINSNTTIEVQDTSSVTGSVGGIAATSSGAGIGGNITINTQATTTVTGESFDGISAVANAAGNITINAQGGVTGNGAGDGIFATATSGTVGVTTGTGAITGADDGIEIVAVANTATVTTGTGAVTGTTGDGIRALGDSVIVGAGGNVTGTTGTGINAIADVGTVSVTTAANTTVTGTGGNGINATAPGAVTVDPDGNVSGSTNGINAVSQNGLVTVTTLAGTTITGTNDDGINAEAQVTGNVVVTALSAVTGNDIGIDANAAGGTVNVTTGIAAVIANAGTGIDATASGAVTVGAGGNVTGTGGIGINAVAQNGNVDVDTAAAFAVSGTTGAGIFANAAVTGNVDVNALSSVGGSTIGIDANATAGTVNVVTGTASVVGAAGTGIDATASGNVTVNAGGSVSGIGGIGINAVAQNGNIDVDTAATFTVNGSTGAGIFANAAVTGNVDVNAQSRVVGSTIGIDANATSGTVNVVTGGGAVLGNAGNGIDATASGNVTVNAGFSVFGTGGTGINAVSSAAGNVGVTTAGNSAVEGTTGDGINAATTGIGIVTITNNSTTQGLDTGIEATSATGAIQITNNAFIRNLGLADDLLAIRTTTTGGATTIANNAFLIGRVITSVGGDTLTNNAFWNTEGDSDFGGGSDTVNNNAFLTGADETGVAETTRFLNLETLSNGAFLDLSDQAVGDGSNISDTLSTSGNYAGGGFFEVDAFLGAGPGSNADQLIVGGDISGVTQILVTDTNAGPGGLNLTGILVVDGNAAETAAAGDFVLAGGPIDKGLFVYDLAFDDANNDFLLVGLPDREVFETLAAVASSQEIWRETADAWSTRQENLRDTLAASRMVTAVADPSVTVSDAPMGSLWVSALGSWSERDDEESFSVFNLNLDFDLSYSQDIYGVVGGADFGMDMGSSSRFLFGVMTGYVDSSLDFDEGSTSIDTDGATVGAYAALLSNGFFATVLVKADLLTMDFSTADDDDAADVTTWGARGDLGYRFGDSLFVEPMLSVDAMSTKIDEFSILGADIDAGTNESFRGGAGVRVGYGGETVRASATARVWDVFSTDNEVDVPGLTVSDDDLEGVYGDVSGQVDVSLSTSTTIYLKGGVLFSDDVTKPNASGGFAFYW